MFRLYALCSIVFAAASFCVSAVSLAAGAASGGAAGRSALAIADPAEAVETWVRLKGDAGGRLTYEWVNGAAWGLPENALAVPLFRFESVTIRRFERQGPARYREKTIACRLYRDFESGRFIDRIFNPFTKLEVRLSAGCNPGPEVEYSSERVALARDIGFRSSALGVPMRLERLDLGDWTVLRRDARSEYAARSGELRRETSLDSFTVATAALSDRSLTSLPASYQWSSVTHWMAELGMRGTPGRMLWSINGRKLDRADELPADFRAALEQAVPGALSRAPQ